MGNASSSSGRGHHEETVDYGYLTPQGIYTGPRDWNQAIVAQLIIDRKLAPFYRPLEEYEESWDDEQILAARKEPPQDPDNVHPESSSTRPESVHSAISRTHHKRPSAASKEPARNAEACVYRGAAECPICFLYYPSNINHSRCCDQAICTECFVQIKRAEPTATHLVSEPAACPYCVQENFGIVYTPPTWRAGINSDGYATPTWPNTSRGTSQQSLVSQPKEAMKKRRKSFGADSPEVVTIDQIRPDWEAKLAAVRAQVARRANRRIIMRQVGDRLIPVGITSGRIQAIPPEEAAEIAEGGGDRGSRRSRRRQQQREDINQYLGSVGLGGQDLEELMIMEAMRLSLLEHEEQERKRKAEEEKKQAAEGTQTAEPGSAGSSAAAPEAGLLAPVSAQSESGLSSSGSSPSHLTPDSTESTNNGTRHRSSSSLSGWRRRSPSPFGTVGTAIRSAATTAGAVATPGSQSETPRPAEGATSTSEVRDSTDNASHAQLPVEEAVMPTQTAASTASEEGAIQPPIVAVIEPEVPESREDSVSSPESDATVATTPFIEGTLAPGRAQRSQSFASSVTSDDGQASTAYDYLPSSPSSSSSSIAHKPLLNSSPSVPPQSYNASPDPSAPSQA